jgi:hypothetical protein
MLMCNFVKTAVAVQHVVSKELITIDISWSLVDLKRLVGSFFNALKFF